MTHADPPDMPEKNSPKDRLAAMLLQHGLVSATQIKAAQALQGDLSKALLDLGFISEEHLTNFFAKVMKIPRLGLQDYQTNGDTVKMVPQALCLTYGVLPIDVLGKSLTLAMVNPLNEEALDAVRAACAGYDIKPFLCTRADFAVVTARLFKAEAKQSSGNGGMSLDSLGFSAKAAPKKAEAPAPPPPVATEDSDVHATMLADNRAVQISRQGGPLRSSLICLDGWELGREVEITGNEHTLGRSVEVNTTLNSPLISREHARLTRNNEYGQETFVITDLGSSNGTFVNNIPVSSTILRHGDRIQLGGILFKFLLLDEVEARFHKDVHRLYSIHKDTGLLPIDAWRRELARTVEAAPATPLTTCLIEIDGLAAIRAAHGHMAGVIVLNDISDLINQQLDKTDLPGEYADGRIAILFEGKPIEAAFPVAEDLRRSVEAHVFHLKEASFRCTISVGMGTVSDVSVSPEAVIVRLEEALASAIANGRNQSCVAT